MIEELGTVVAIETLSDGHGQDQQTKRMLLIETTIKSTCSSCHAQQNCGTSVVAKAFTRQTQRFTLPCDDDVVVGQKVKLGIAEERLLTASLLVYGLPILALIVGASLMQILLAQLSVSGELWVVLSAFASAILTFMAVKHYINASTSSHYCPQIIEVLPLSHETILFKAIE
jgi:sigma-E factor negative regulatory protein RseC